MTKPKKSKARGPKPRTSKPKPQKPGANTDHLDASNLDPSQPLKDARQERFVVNLAMHGMTNGQAYILAGYAVTDPNVGSACATRLLKDAKISARLVFLQQRAISLAVDMAQVNKADVLNMIAEQHQRNIGVRPVTITRPIKHGKDKGKMETIETYVYSDTAASQTLKLLSDEYGLGQGASGARGEGGDTIDARAKLEDPSIQQDLENLNKVRSMVLIESGLAEAPPAPVKKAPLDPVQAAARLKKLAEG